MGNKQSSSKPWLTSAGSELGTAEVQSATGILDVLVELISAYVYSPVMVLAASACDTAASLWGT